MITLSLLKKHKKFIFAILLVLISIKLVYSQNIYTRPKLIGENKVWISLEENNTTPEKKSTTFDIVQVECIFEGEKKEYIGNGKYDIQPAIQICFKSGTIIYLTNIEYDEVIKQINHNIKK